MKKPSVYAYVNFRDYLKDWYAWMKKTRSGFSYRAFSKWAGLKSPNQLKLIIQGKRNLTAAYQEKYMNILKLGIRERQYFLNLVRLEYAPNDNEKTKIYAEISTFWKKPGQKIRADQYEYLSNWYYPVLREWVQSERFREDAPWLARQLYEQITPSQIKRALKNLQVWGFLKREGWRLVQSQSYVTTGEAPSYLAAFQYHSQMLEQAKRALEQEPPNQRDFSALTFLFPQNALKILTDKIAAMRQEFISLIEEYQQKEKGDKIFQFSILLFPLTKGD